MTDTPDTAVLWRTAAACFATVSACLIAGPYVIRLMKRRLTERITSDSTTLDTLHASKHGTPTMGGVLIIGGMVLGFSLCHDAAIPDRLLAVAVTGSFGLLGAIDDWVKATSLRKGLSVRQKLLGQIGLALATATALTSWPPKPVAENAALGDPAMVLWPAFVLIATCNAVNLTDGLDGLATGCMAICAAALAAVFLQTPQTAGIGQMAAVLAVAAAAFLWFNRYPAQIFMGDTGALAMGAVLGLLALQARREWLLGIAGIVFAAETLSVIAQVLWFKRTGRRLLLCSPLHNHFVFRKIPEHKIVGVFWMAGLAAAAATVLCTG
jgi:phospho-N-acetylmuramoyl-pentapeptide-transferase